MIETNLIHCVNTFSFLEQLPDECVDLTLTSPPVWKGGGHSDDFGQEHYLEDYLQKMWHMMYEIIRITKSTGHIVINIGDKYDTCGWLVIPYRFAMEITEEECKLINIISWIKKNPIAKQSKNKLMPSVEPFFHFVKSNDYYYNLRAFQRKKSDPSCLKKPDTHIGQKYFTMIQLSTLTDEQKASAEEHLKMAIEEVKEGSIQSFRMKIKGMHHYEGHMSKEGFTLLKYPINSAVKRDVIECSVESVKGVTIFPEKLVKELLYLCTKSNDVVFDPFCGSGTTCVVAKKMNRRYIGADICPNFCKIAKSRLED